MVLLLLAGGCFGITLLLARRWERLFTTAKWLCRAKRLEIGLVVLNVLRVSVQSTQLWQYMMFQERRTRS